MNYKGSSGYGTIMGGCISLVVTTFTFVFIGIQLYALVFEPSYNQNESVDYLSRTSAEVYEVPIRSFIPSFGYFIENDSGERSYNPREILEIKWIMTDWDKKIETVSCKELVDSFDHLQEGVR